MTAPSRHDQKSPLTLALTGPPASVAAFRNSAFVKAMRAGNGNWSHKVLTQFDTADRQLAARGYKLFLTHSPAGREQLFLRANKLPGVVARNDVQTIMGIEDEFPALSGEFEFDCALRDLRQSLVQIAETKTETFLAPLQYRNVEIGAAFDFSVCTQTSRDSGQRAISSARVVFKRRRGSRSSMFELLRISAKESGLYPSVVRAENQQVGVSGNSAICPIPKPLIDENDNAGDVLRSAVQIIAERIISLLPLIIEQRDAQALQQMRVAIRRLRAVERLYRPYVTDATLKRLAKRGRRYARRLGPARDWDVFLNATLPAAARRDYAAYGFEKLRWRAEAHRAAAWDDGLRAVSGYGFMRFSIDLLEAAHRAPWLAGSDAALSGCARAFVPLALDVRLAAASDIAARIDRNSLLARHPLRIALKQLRYTVQMFRSLYPKDIRKPFMAEMARLQDALGDINDAATSHALAEIAAMREGDEAMRAAGFLYGMSASQAQAAALAIDEAWDAFELQKPFWRE